MSKVTLSYPFEKMQGKTSGDGKMILRCKQFRDANGRIIAEGPQEAYVITNPRDRKKNPPTGAEKQYIELFAEASRRTTVEIAPDSPRRAYWQQRFQAQLTAPEHLNPSDSASPLRKTYRQLNTFVRSTIYNDLKSELTARQSAILNADE